MSATTTAQGAAPRFALHQQVRIIANQGGLYAAQIGVGGVISKQRTKRRYGYRFYDVSYMKPFSLPNEKGREKIVIVREDDLEAVETEAPAIYPKQSGICVDCKRCDVSGLNHFHHDHRCHTCNSPICGCHAAHYDTNECVACRQKAKNAAKPTKPAEQPPRFAIGEHVTVDLHSAACYAPYARKGAVGVIVGVGKPVRGIRRYDVRYGGTPAAAQAAQRDPLHLLPMTQIREEHLLAAPEAPAPQPTTTLRHAHEYRDEKPRGAHLWCDAGGCFIEACAICRAYLGDTLTVSPVERADEPTPPTSVACDHDWQAIPADDGKPRLRRCRLCGGVGVGCAHDWQVWPDGRYRHCPKCKLSERAPAREEMAHVASE